MVCLGKVVDGYLMVLFLFCIDCGLWWLLVMVVIAVTYFTDASCCGRIACWALRCLDSG